MLTSREMDDVIFTWGGPHGSLQVNLTTMIFLLNGYVGRLWHIHFYQKEAFHVRDDG